MEEMATLLTIGAQEKLAITIILQRHPELKSLGAAIRWAIRQAGGTNPSIEGGEPTPFVPEGTGPFIGEAGSASFSDAYDFGHLGTIPILKPGKYSLKRAHTDKSVRISLADLKWQTEARELVTDIGALRFMGWREL